MRQISDELIAALDHKVLMARITLDGTTLIQNDPEGDEPIQSIHFEDGAGGEADAVTVGSTIAASVTVYLEKALVDYDLTGRKMHIELGMELESGEEWFDMGTYTITDAENDDGTVTVIGMDAIAAKMDTEYEPIAGYDFESEEGVSAQGFVTAACQRLGITVDFEDLQDQQLKLFSPEGCTWRQLIGFIAALYGRFARICRDGVLRFVWFQDVDIRITADDYYEDGLLKGAYDFSVGWIKCYNEVLEETLTEGYPSRDQGIYFSCPWMTPEILAWLWLDLDGYTYAPVPDLTFFGDPRPEAGDAIRLVCLDGKEYRVPVMGITHDWDGGLMTSISAIGQVKSDAYEGPVQRETKRTIAKILKKADGIEMSVENTEQEISYLKLQADDIEARVEDNEGDISALEVRADELEAKAEDAAGNIAALQIQADEVSSQVEGFAEEVTKVSQMSGKVKVTATDANGTLVTEITPNVWGAKRTDRTGKVTSSIEFDFACNQFVFNGTGKFMAPDGKSYITIEGNTFCMYAQQGDAGDFKPIARIGFSEDSEGYDYPYVLLGNDEDESSSRLGLVKQFANGIYIGNSAPRLSTGSFIGLMGAVGFFINTQEGRTYSVLNDNLYDSFTAVFA